MLGYKIKEWKCWFLTLFATGFHCSWDQTISLHLYTQCNAAICALSFDESHVTGVGRCVNTGCYVFPGAVKTKDKEQKQDIDGSLTCENVNSFHNDFHLYI